MMVLPAEWDLKYVNDVIFLVHCLVSSEILRSLAGGAPQAHIWIHGYLDSLCNLPH